MAKKQKEPKVVTLEGVISLASIPPNMKNIMLQFKAIKLNTLRPVDCEVIKLAFAKNKTVKIIIEEIL